MSDKPIISQETMAALLGRPLSDLEIANYDLYLELAIERLDDLLCIKLEDMDDLPVRLKLLIARAFNVMKQEQAASESHGIDKKQVEDFSISFQADASSPMTYFVEQNLSILNQNSKCQGSIRSGNVYSQDSFRCI